MAPALQKGIREGGMAAETVSVESYPPAWVVCGIKGHLPAAEHKIPPGHPLRNPAHAEIMALKGSVAQGFASLGRMGREGEADTVELLGIRARSAKAGFSGC